MRIDSRLDLRQLEGRRVSKVRRFTSRKQVGILRRSGRVSVSRFFNKRYKAQKPSPADPTQYRDALKEILRRDGIVFVQLLSQSLGRKLITDDEDSRVVRLQFEVAQKQCAPICQWRSVSLGCKPLA